MVDAILIRSNVTALGAHGDPQTHKVLTWGARRTPRLEQENPIGWRAGMFLGSGKGQGSALALARAQLLACLETCTLALTSNRKVLRENGDRLS